MTSSLRFLSALTFGSAAFIAAPAAFAQAAPMAFDCFDRSSGALIAQSNSDITSSAVQCVPTGGEARKSSSPPSDPFAAKRALNLARGTAIALNGGLSKYRPSICMFQTAAKNPCITQSDNSGLEFTIYGGKPGWEESGENPTLLTVVKITSDGRAVIESRQN